MIGQIFLSIKIQPNAGGKFQQNRNLSIMIETYVVRVIVVPTSNTTETFDPNIIFIYMPSYCMYSGCMSFVHARLMFISAPKLQIQLFRTSLTLSLPLNSLWGLHPSSVRRLAVLSRTFLIESCLGGCDIKNLNASSSERIADTPR